MKYLIIVMGLTSFVFCQLNSHSTENNGRETIVSKTYSENDLILVEEIISESRESIEIEQPRVVIEYDANGRPKSSNLLVKEYGVDDLILVEEIISESRESIEIEQPRLIFEHDANGRIVE